MERLIGRGSTPFVFEVPFTLRAKTALEVAWAIASELHHASIDTEHLLLGIVQEGERILARPDGEPSRSIAFQVLENPQLLAVYEKIIAQQHQECQQQRIERRN